MNQIEKIVDYKGLAKEELQKGNKIGAKLYLLKKKNLQEKIKTFDSIIVFMEEQKMILDNTRQIQQILISIKNSQKIIEEEENRGITIESLENMKEDMQQINDNYSKEGDN